MTAAALTWGKTSHFSETAWDGGEGEKSTIEDSKGKWEKSTKELRQQLKQGQ